MYYTCSQRFFVIYKERLHHICIHTKNVQDLETLRKFIHSSFCLHTMICKKCISERRVNLVVGFLNPVEYKMVLASSRSLISLESRSWNGNIQTQRLCCCCTNHQKLPIRCNSGSAISSVSRRKTPAEDHHGPRHLHQQLYYITEHNTPFIHTLTIFCELCGFLYKRSPLFLEPGIVQPRPKSLLSSYCIATFCIILLSIIH